MTNDEEDYEPGLGCPHCKWAGYTPDERAAHIYLEHPGQYQGPTEDMRMVMERMGASTRVSNTFHDRRGD